MAVELDERQAKVLQERVIALEVKEEPDLAKRQPKDFFGHLVTGPSLVPLEQRLVEEPEDDGVMESFVASGKGEPSGCNWSCVTVKLGWYEKLPKVTKN